MPRTGRVVIDGGTYHVLTRGNNGQAVFHHDADHQRYLQLLSTYAKEHELKIFHFALMPNHVHLVLEVARGEALSKAMLGLNLSYALHFSRRYRYTGHVWQGRFKSLAIDRESYLLECGRYVELNPVRAGLVQDPARYPWSSYRVYAEGASIPFLTLNPLYESLGVSVNNRQHHYRQFIRDGMARQPVERVQLRQPIIVMSPPKPKSLESLLGLRRPGRPKKVLPAAAAGTIETSPFSITVLKNAK